VTSTQAFSEAAEKPTVKDLAEHGFWLAENADGPV